MLCKVVSLVNHVPVNAPVKIDVPEFRAKFLQLYYGRYLRPLKDYMVGGLEFIAPLLGKVPWLYNIITDNPISKFIFKYTLGMIDTPRMNSGQLENLQKKLGIPYASHDSLSTLSQAQRQKTVLIVQDAFTSYFDNQVVSDCLELLKRIGFLPQVIPFYPNGKTASCPWFF